MIVAYSKALQKLVNEKQLDAGHKLGQVVGITNKANWTAVTDDSKDAIIAVADEVSKNSQHDFQEKVGSEGDTKRLYLPTDSNANGYISRQSESQGIRV